VILIGPSLGEARSLLRAMIGTITIMPKTKTIPPPMKSHRLNTL